MSIGYMLAIGGKNKLFFKALLAIGATLAAANYIQSIELSFYLAAIPYSFIFGLFVALMTGDANRKSYDDQPAYTPHQENKKQKNPPTAAEIDQDRRLRLAFLRSIRAGKNTGDQPDREQTSNTERGRSAHEILQVDPTATKEEIKASYDRLRMKYHPDRHQKESPEFIRDTTERFKSLSEAYKQIG